MARLVCGDSVGEDPPSGIEADTEDGREREGDGERGGRLERGGTVPHVLVTEVTSEPLFPSPHPVKEVGKEEEENPLPWSGWEGAGNEALRTLRLWWLVVSLL